MNCIDFDYILWTTDDGKRSWAKIKSTGETIELDKPTMRFLRAEEKRLWRAWAQEHFKKDDFEDGIRRSRAVSLEQLLFDSSPEPACLANPADFENEMIHLILEQQLKETLTGKQLEVYCLVIEDGVTIAECAQKCGISYQGIQSLLKGISKKAKFFME